MNRVSRRPPVFRGVAIGVATVVVVAVGGLLILSWPSRAALTVVNGSSLRVVSPHPSAVSSSTECPAGAPRPKPGQLPRAGVEMVPGDPVRFVACRYAASDESPPGETLQSTAGASNFASIAADLNAGRRVSPTAVYHCPLGHGGEYLLRFGYRDGRTLWTRVNPSGCTFATNGDRTVFAPLAVLSELGFILRAPGSQLHPPYTMTVYASQPCDGQADVGPGDFRPGNQVVVRVFAPDGSVIGTSTMSVHSDDSQASDPYAECVGTSTVRGLPRERSYRVTVQDVEIDRVASLHTLQFGGWRVHLSWGFGTLLQ